MSVQRAIVMYVQQRLFLHYGTRCAVRVAVSRYALPLCNCNAVILTRSSFTCMQRQKHDKSCASAGGSIAHPDGFSKSDCPHDEHLIQLWPRALLRLNHSHLPASCATSLPTCKPILTCTAASAERPVVNPLNSFQSARGRPRTQCRTDKHVCPTVAVGCRRCCVQYLVGACGDDRTIV